MVRLADRAANSAGDPGYNQHQEHQSDLYAGHNIIIILKSCDLRIKCFYFIQDKSFLSMLGDIRYNEWGQVVGAGAVEVDNVNLF